MTDDFFIPRRKKRPISENLNITSSGKRFKYNDESGVLIIDESNQEKESAVVVSKIQRQDFESELVQSVEEWQRKKENVEVTVLLACKLYLDPETVMTTVLYWLSLYVDYSKRQSEWFNSLITGLLEQPVRLDLSSSQGIAHTYSKIPKYTLLMHFAGTNLHKVPSQYFYLHDNAAVLESLAYLIRPENDSFLVKNSFGLKGEIELAAFRYNSVLSYFYEPSFLIITSYLLFVHYLFNLTHGRSLSDFLPTLKIIRKPLKSKRLNFDRLLCLDHNNSNYEEKRAMMERDLQELALILTETDMKKLLDDLTRLWSKKASYVDEQKVIRRDLIYSQLQH
jgi:hypothetical protein